MLGIKQFELTNAKEKAKNNAAEENEPDGSDTEADEERDNQLQNLPFSQDETQIRSAYQKLDEILKKRFADMKDKVNEIVHRFKRHDIPKEGP